jgi:hypothetical protein
LCDTEAPQSFGAVELRRGAAFPFDFGGALEMKQIPGLEIDE